MDFARLVVPGDLSFEARREFITTARADTPEEVNYYRHGGILPYVLRQML